MNEKDLLAREFEAHRRRLSAVAYRMLGSAAEAEDAVQESWLRLNRAGADDVSNLGGWLTTVVARVCLDMLRSRKARREDVVGDSGVPDEGDPNATDAEAELELAGSVGLALLVVLETLAPPERLAFVLHDMFGVPFEEIAEIVGRTPAATRQLASRARRRVQGAPATADPAIGKQLAIVEAFLRASRGGSVEGLVAVLDPDAVLHADAVILPPGLAPDARGAETIARRAASFSHRAHLAAPALVDGRVGIVVAPRGKLAFVMRLTFRGDRIASLDFVGDPQRLRDVEIHALP
jgi:RNA polymerase sigma-70 factor (ECF subfamily)